MYDAIIIGTGFGGLTAAAVLAKRGYSTLTLEAANELGGSASKFDRDGYRFAAGATVGMGFEKGGVFAQLFEELEMPIPTMNKLDTIMNVYLPDRKVSYYAEKELWYKEADRVFGQKENIQFFFEEVFSVANKLYSFVDKKVIFPPATLGEWKKLLYSVDVKTLSLAPFLTKSVYDGLVKYNLHTNKEFMTFINGQLMDSVQTTAERSPALLGYMALRVFHKGAYYVNGGLASVIHALADSIEQNGGDVKKRKRVVSIKKQSNHWVVETKRGEQFKAKKVIVNAPIHNIFTLLSEEAQNGLAVKQEKEERQESWGAFTLYVGAEEGFLDESSYSIPFHQFIGSYDRPLSEGNQFLFSISQPGDTLFAPVGKRAITISTHTEAKQWWNRNQYDELKKNYTDRILQTIERTYPTFKEQIETNLPGTPVTFHRYTQRKLGLVGGYVPTSKFSLFKAYSPNSGIEGLWLCGDTVFPGAGSLGSSLSGWTVANEIGNKRAGSD
ncbi:phytoene desaturase family protein [Mangrovibacillus cuniculi]|uniref:FAD-dependent oxidoreductase n=1 Tax=Mangrovibacillus cuniculi TaxID=2593652 RepID=A0A7S8C929_9BACI|nr:FAD-dependent oxidoreductase [Mangrovibacillus cuniculi]QPC45629.1 FAD-dependent oxidoreductase [Mangrovibacillus cuniculi]